MWRPTEDIESFNRDLVQLEQELLAFLRGDSVFAVLRDSDALTRLWRRIDENPYQALAMTPRHGLNVMLLARAWAVVCHRLGEALADFSLAALVHDLGHWRPPDLIYVFGPFTHEEARQMRRHAEIDPAELEGLSERALLWIAQHHEQPDGKGYPAGAREPEMLSQALRIVDCFDGLTTARSFRLFYSYPEAMQLMTRWSGRKYNAGLFQSFRRFLGRFPPGSRLRLRNGAAGVSLPGLEEEGHCLILTNEEGDRLADPRLERVALSDIAGEAPRWLETAIPSEWENLRPDLLGLSRHWDRLDQ